MAYIPNSGGIVDYTLASAWTNGGTITINYPTGMVQADFTAGLLDEAASFVLIDGNYKLSVDPTSASGFALTTLGASTITVTNNTGASIAAGSVLKFWIAQRPGNSGESFQFPFTMSSIANGDLVSAFRPGLDGYIENIEWIQGVPVTTGSKLSTLSLKINSTAVTGGAVALTSALCTPIGARVAGSRITGANRITKKDSLTVIAASTTAFVEGTGTLIVRMRRDII